MKPRFELIYDPMSIDDGGFEPGTCFGKEDVLYMLQNFAFTEGTTLRYGRKHYRVETRKSHYEHNVNVYRHYLVDIKTGNMITKYAQVKYGNLV
jgi:hypothetical protein